MGKFRLWLWRRRYRRWASMVSLRSCIRRAVIDIECGQCESFGDFIYKMGWMND